MQLANSKLLVLTEELLGVEHRLFELERNDEGLHVREIRKGRRVAENAPQS